MYQPIVPIQKIDRVHPVSRFLLHPVRSIISCCFAEKTGSIGGSHFVDSAHCGPVHKIRSQSYD